VLTFDGQWILLVAAGFWQNVLWALSKLYWFVMDVRR